LLALGGRVALRSTRGERVVPLDEFYTGVRGTVMQPDELLVDIVFPAMRSNQRGTFIKLGLRQAQAISLVSVAMVVNLKGGVNGSINESQIDSAVITLGAVAPTVVRARQAEAFLEGRILDSISIEEAARLAMDDAKPISDVRSSAAYRHEMVRICTLRGLRSVSKGEERQDYPEPPITLGGKKFGSICQTNGSAAHFIEGGTSVQPIITRINGKEFQFSHGHQKTLLRLIREEAGLIGTKEGCAEGECGACTVFLDGMAVMSCLVPAPRAHGAEIETIEGLIQAGNLHPVQQAFIDEGAVQCGYCTPGFVMSGVKLLEERSQPTHDEVRQAITGNLCRCTGYYKIIRAIERAAGQEVLDEP